MIYNVYLAAPIVNISEEQKEKIECVESYLNHMDCNGNRCNVYNPSKHSVPNAWGMNMDEWSKCIFALDVVAMDNADWIVVCDFGRQMTSGTAWEAGYVFGRGKKILVIRMNNDDDNKNCSTEYSVMMNGCSSNSIDYNYIKSIVYSCDQSYSFGDVFVERGRIKQNNNVVYN